MYIYIMLKKKCYFKKSHENKCVILRRCWWMSRSWRQSNELWGILFKQIFADFFLSYSFVHTYRYFFWIQEEKEIRLKRNIFRNTHFFLIVVLLMLISANIQYLFKITFCPSYEHISWIFIFSVFWRGRLNCERLSE